MTVFVSLTDLGLESSTTSLLQDWVSQIQAQYPGYQPNAGNLEYLMAQIMASWAADLATLASTVGDEVFQEFGTSLVGLQYIQGASAIAVVNVQAATSTGGLITYTLPAGTQFSLDGLGFTSQSDVSIVSGTSSAVTLAAVAPGTLFNGAGSSGGAQLLEQIDWVSSVTLVTSALGGIDAESDESYRDRLTATLRLMAPRPITANDYAVMALNFNPAYGTDQTEVGRATALDGYDPTAYTFTGTVNNTTTVSSVSSFDHITNGSAISGTGIPAGATVQSFDLGASTLVLSQAATGPASGHNYTLTSTGTYGNERMVTLCVADALGIALNSDTKTAIQTWLDGMREVNFVINVIDPTYTAIYITVSVHPLTGWDSTTVKTNIQNSLLAFLNPTHWGSRLFVGNDSGVTHWTNTTVIRRSQVEAVIQNTAGVDYVVDGTLAIGTTATPTNTTTDVTLTGAVPFPTSNVTTIPLSGITIV